MRGVSDPMSSCRRPPEKFALVDGVILLTISAGTQRRTLLVSIVEEYHIEFSLLTYPAVTSLQDSA